MKFYAANKVAKAQATKQSTKTGHSHIVTKVGEEWLVSTAQEAAELLKTAEATEPKKTANRGVTIEQVKALNLDLIQSIRAYAKGNYSYGWDLIEECWSDEDITQYIGNTKSLHGAIAKLYSVVSLRNSQEAETAM